MSISGVGLYSQHNMDEAVVSQAAQQAKPALPPSEVDQQAKAALAQANYQPTISTYGQAQNAMAILKSTVQGLDQSAHSGDASGGHPAQLNAAHPATIAQATQAAQSFVNAYNANGSGSGQPVQNSEALSGIGITSHAGGTLTLDARAFRKALSANPENAVKVFSSLAETVQQKHAAAAVSQPHSQVSGQPQGNQHAPFASRASNAPQNPAPAQQVESRAATSTAAGMASLASQYSVISRLG